MIYRAAGLIELLTTLTIMAMALLFFSPVLFQWQDTLKLQQEVNLLKSFLYQVQAHSHYKQKDYLLFLHQDLSLKRWCAVAIVKTSLKSPPCNCLIDSACHQSAESLHYRASFPSIILRSRDLYPSVFLTINARGTLDSRCLKLTLNQVSQILQTNSLGVINVAQQNKRTQCQYSLSRIELG
ncbi:MAG: Type II secretory pathway, pseudopilin PulG [Pasteurellaceae bacterium]|nr:Type II secretory pathway, pseudopilin PulG [Pasteurellaceae bacterium]